MKRGMVFLWSALGLFIFIVVCFLALKIWFDAYLRSDGFRKLISGVAFGAIQARGEFLPFHYSGTTIYTDGFQARGAGTAFFDQLRADQMRAEFNLRGILKHAWEIDELELQQLQITVGNQKNREPAPSPAPGAGGPGWLPSKVDLRQADIEDASLEWAGETRRASVKGTKLTITPEAAGSMSGENAANPGSWNILAEGGHIATGDLPGLEVSSAKLRYRRPSLFILDSEFKCKEEGSLTASGEINFEQSLDLELKLNGVPLRPLLPVDWRRRLDGNLYGDIRLLSAMPLTGEPDMEGSLSLAQARVEALPILDQIALFTRSQQFRTLSLSKASGDFKRTQTRLEVKNFVAEAEGLIRMEGAFTVQDGRIDGAFQIGVTPGSLQWLPGSQGKVFTDSREGYLWTHLHLTGPVESPIEDLTPRLVQAAQGAIIDKAQKALTDPAGTLLDGVKSLLPP